MNSAGGAAGRAWTKQSVGAVQLQAGIGGAMGWTEHKRKRRGGKWGWPALLLSFLLALSSWAAEAAAIEHQVRVDTEPPPLTQPLLLQLTQTAPPATIDPRPLGQGRPEAMRQCLQQALFWLGRYQGSLDGRASPAFSEAIQGYAATRSILLRLPETSSALLHALEHDLAAIGKVEEWQACLKTAGPE
jgi:hypothetical protein